MRIPQILAFCLAVGAATFVYGVHAGPPEIGKRAELDPSREADTEKSEKNPTPPTKMEMSQARMQRNIYIDGVVQQLPNVSRSVGKVIIDALRDDDGKNPVPTSFLKWASKNPENPVARATIQLIVLARGLERHRAAASHKDEEKPEGHRAECDCADTPDIFSCHFKCTAEKFRCADKVTNAEEYQTKVEHASRLLSYRSGVPKTDDAVLAVDEVGVLLPCNSLTQPIVF